MYIQNMKDWGRNVFVFTPTSGVCVALMIVKELQWTTEKQKGEAMMGDGVGQSTDGRATLLFFKLGEFFPWCMIRIIYLIYFSTTFKDTIYQDQNQKPTTEINKKCLDI